MKPRANYVVNFDGTYSDIYAIAPEVTVPEDGISKFVKFTDAKRALLDYIRAELTGWQMALRKTRTMKVGDTLMADPDVSSFDYNLIYD